MPAANTSDRPYFLHRAREERERAVICEDNVAAIAHLSLANEYEKRAAEIYSKLRTAGLVAADASR